MSYSWLHEVGLYTALATAVAYLSRLGNSLLNHKATENTKLIVDTMHRGFMDQTASLTTVITKGHTEIVEAIKDSHSVKL